MDTLRVILAKKGMKPSELMAKAGLSWPTVNSLLDSVPESTKVSTLLKIKNVFSDVDFSMSIDDNGVKNGFKIKKIK